MALCLMLTGCISEETKEETAGGDNDMATELVFSSFDGGGPDYSIHLEDPGFVSFTKSRQYKDDNHDELDGAAFEIVFVFTGIQPGETYMVIEERSPIAGYYDHRYHVMVDESLNVTLKKLSTTDLNALTEPSATLVIHTDNGSFYANLANNSSAKAFLKHLNSEVLTVEMHDYGNFEKVGDLPWELPANDELITTKPGDIILYQGNKITIYYDEDTWEFTRLGEINVISREELLEVFGDGDVTVTFWLEWSE